MLRSDRGSGLVGVGITWGGVELAEGGVEVVDNRGKCSTKVWSLGK